MKRVRRHSFTTLEDATRQYNEPSVTATETQEPPAVATTSATTLPAVVDASLEVSNTVVKEDSTGSISGCSSRKRGGSPAVNYVEGEGSPPSKRVPASTTAHSSGGPVEDTVYLPQGIHCVFIAIVLIMVWLLSLISRSQFVVSGASR